MVQTIWDPLQNPDCFWNRHEKHGLDDGRRKNRVLGETSGVSWAICPETKSFPAGVSESAAGEIYPLYRAFSGYKDREFGLTTFPTPPYIGSFPDTRIESSDWPHFPPHHCILSPAPVPTVVYSTTFTRKFAKNSRGGPLLFTFRPILNFSPILAFLFHPNSMSPAPVLAVVLLLFRLGYPTNNSLALIARLLIIPRRPSPLTSWEAFRRVSGL